MSIATLQDPKMTPQLHAHASICGLFLRLWVLWKIYRSWLSAPLNKIKGLLCLPFSSFFFWLPLLQTIENVAAYSLGLCASLKHFDLTHYPSEACRFARTRNPEDFMRSALASKPVSAKNVHWKEQGRNSKHKEMKRTRVILISWPIPCRLRILAWLTNI